MRNLFASVGLATPEEQSKKAGALSRAYRTFLSFAQGTLEKTKAGMRDPSGYGREWKSAIERGDIPFDPVGGLVSTGAKAVGKSVVSRWKDVLSTALRKRDYVAGLRKNIAGTFGQGRKGLPKLRSSEEAMTFGADWAGDQRIADLLRAARKETDAEWKQLYNAGRKNEALKVGQEGQLYTEALETIEGKMKPSFLKDFGYEGYEQLPTKGTELEELFRTAKEDIRKGMIEAFSGK